MKTTLKRDNEKDSSSKKRNHLADNQSEKFIWSDEMTEYSLEFLKSYNITCDYSGTDFDADKTQQYPHVLKEMARKYEGFGHIDAIGRSNYELSTDEKKAY